MGLRDRLTVDWKNKIITYQDVDFYVVDQFEYKEIIYLYVVDTNISDNMVKIMFLKNEKENTYSHVETESDLYKELMEIETGRITMQQLEKEIEKIKQGK